VTDVTLLSTYLSQEQVPSLQNNKNSFNRGAGKRSLISLAVAMALATGASQINAAGLGRLSVQSALGQPLRAEVEVTALGKDEVGNIVAKLASQDAFKQAGLEYSPALSNLRFTVDKRADGRHFVRITSAVPINEPFVDLMVELTWPTGRFVREYTFLLDPAELKVGGQSVAGGETRTETVVPPAPLASVTPSAPVAPAVPSGLATAPSTVPAAPVVKAVATPKATPKATAPAAASTAGSSGNYDVKRGDTLARIAARNKPSSVSLEQAIVAIYRANPSAFLGNVNRLKANVSLNIPEEGAMAAVSVAEARQEVRVRSTGFSSYKTRVARAAKAAPSVAKAGQSASGAISGQVVDAGQKPAAQDQVKLSKGAGKGAGSASALGASGKEAKIASGAALSEANSRVSALEKNVSDLQKLLAAKDKQLADAQDRLKTAGTAGKSVDGVIGKAPAATAKVDAAKVELPKADAKAAKIEVPKLDVPKVDIPKIEAPKVVAKVDTPKLEVPKIDTPAAGAKPATPPVVVPPVVAPTAPAVPAGVATDPLSKFDTPKSDAGKVEPPKVDATVPKVEAPKVEAPKVETSNKSVAPVPVAEKGILDTIQEDYPFALPGLGGLALVGGAYGLYAMRRRKKAEKFEDSLMEGEAFSANSLFGTTGGQNVDTSVATNATSTKTESGVEVGSTEVDPIAEAEVYIAYGREGQAEEILKEALRKQGDRQAIRMKLLEIYAGRKDIAAFESVAREMHAQTRGKNEEWPKVVTLGMSIDPSNSLYTGNDSGSGSGLSGGALGGIAAAGALGVGAIGAGFSALGGKAEAAVGGLSQAGKNAGSSAIDSLQAASQIVPPIPDFMAEQKFGDTKPLDTKTESLDFDFTPKTTISKAAERLTGNTQMPDVGNSFGELDLPSLDLPAKAGASIATAKKVAADDLDFSIDLPSLEALTGNGAASSNAFDMDFNSTATAVASTTTQSAAWQEMATKLDLAAAYEEIGDKDGARELLDEVVKGGDSSQQQKAKAMLSKLS
jgi:pilus assembly protein FimV